MMDQGGSNVGDGEILSLCHTVDVSITDASVKYLREATSLLSSFRGEKTMILKSIGFDGLHNIDIIDSLDDQLSVWLLSNLDTETMSLRTLGSSTLEIKDIDVHLVMGIPYKGIEIEDDLNVLDPVMREVRKKLFLGDSSGDITIPYLEGLLRKEYYPVMTYEEKEAFKISVVLYNMTCLLAVRGQHPHIPLGILNYVFVTSRIRKVNWAGYVMKVIKEAALSMQQAVRTNRRHILVSGCMLFLQIYYIDNIDFGTERIKHEYHPRVAAYAHGCLMKLVAADRLPEVVGRLRCYGVHKVIPKGEVCYSRGLLTVHPEPRSEASRNKYIEDVELAAISLVESSKNRLMADMWSLVDKAHSKLLEEFISAMKSHPTEVDLTRSAPVVEEGCGNSAKGDGWQDISRGAGINIKRRFSASMTGSRKRRLPNQVGRTTRFGCVLPQYTGGVCPDGYLSNVEATRTSESALSRFPGIFAAMRRRLNRGISIPQADMSVKNVATTMQEGREGGLVDDISTGIQVDEALAIVAYQHSKPAYFYVSADQSNVASVQDVEQVDELSILPSQDAQTPEDVGNTYQLAIVPYIYEAIQSFVPKVVNEHSDYLDSPFLAGYHHYMPDRKRGRAFMKCMESGLGVEFHRIWFEHDVPWKIQFDGHSLLSQFKRGGIFSVELVDALMRLYTELDDKMYGANRKRWRCYLPATFASSVFNGDDYLAMKEIRDLFIGDHLNYDFEHCRLVIAPVLFRGKWSCYIWDLSAMDLLVLDPMMMNTTEERAETLHAWPMKTLTNALVECTHTFFDGWGLPDGEWFTSAQIDISGRCRRANSGVYSVHYARWYEGLNLHKRITDVELGEIRANMLYQLIRMCGNDGDLPSIIEF